MGDRVFTIVAQFKHMMKFRRRGRLALKNMSLFEIVERVSKVVDTLALLASMDHIHDVFHFSLLLKYIGDNPYIGKTILNHLG